jgi:hypothetical protein
MSIVTHLETLQQKHAALSYAVEEESRRPSPDFLKITSLKKQKLALKEEIRQYEEQATLIMESTG